MGITFVFGMKLKNTVLSIKIRMSFDFASDVMGIDTFIDPLIELLAY